jgi:hypothetical protein
VSETLLYTKLAADLLRELEDISDDERIGEDNYQRLMAAVLEKFHTVEQLTVQVLTHENKPGNPSESPEDVGEIG